MSRTPPDPRGWNKPDGTPLTGREMMAKQKDKKTKAQEAERLIKRVDDRIGEALALTRQSETLLIDLEDRAARRANRRRT